MTIHRLSNRLKETAGPLSGDKTISIIKKSVGIMKVHLGCSHPYYGTMLELRPGACISPSILKDMVKALAAMGWQMEGKPVKYKAVRSKELTFEMQFRDDEIEETEGNLASTRYRQLLYLSAARAIWLG